MFSAPSNSHRIVLNFTFMETECTYDYLFVYDGDSYQSPLLASLSGKTMPQPIEAKSGKVFMEELVKRNKNPLKRWIFQSVVPILPVQMLLHLFSDANYNLLGFNATYTFSLCPGACGGHGRCDSSTLKCLCQQGWGGAACMSPLCSESCSVNGQCDKVGGGDGGGHVPLPSALRTCLLTCVHRFYQKGERCVCKPGFMGQNCQLGLSDDAGAGRWWRVTEGNPYIPPRTGSAGVYLSPTGSLYMFGGKNPSVCSGPQS